MSLLNEQISNHFYPLRFSQSKTERGVRWQLVYQIYLPAIDTLVTGMGGPGGSCGLLALLDFVGLVGLVGLDHTKEFDDSGFLMVSK